MQTELKFEYETFEDAHNVFSILLLVYGYDDVKMDYDIYTITVKWLDTTEVDISKLARVLGLIRNLEIKTIAQPQVEEVEDDIF